MFSSSFCALFWLKNKGKCPGLTFSNELISRDEGLHRDFAIELLKMCPRLEQSVVEDIVREAVDVELRFVDETLPSNLEGMNKQMMRQYVQFVANHLLTSLGYPEFYRAKNPFPFMEAISLNGKTNFFEKRVSERSTALLVPCNVCVAMTADNVVEVAAIDPYALLGVVNRKDALRELVEEVRTMIKAGLAG